MMRRNFRRNMNIGYVYKKQNNNSIIDIPNIKNLSTNLESQSGNGVDVGDIKSSPHELFQGVENIEFNNNNTIGSGIKEPKMMPTVIGEGISVKGNLVGKILPGQALKRKLLMKMLKDKEGGGLVIPGTSSGQSVSKDLAKSYKINPKKGGFIIAGIAAIIAAIASAASAAGAVAVGGTTVAAITGSALTGAAGVAGAELTKKLFNKKGDGLKDKIVKIIKSSKINFESLNKSDQELIKNSIMKLLKNKNKKGVIEFGKKISPIVLKTTKKIITPKINKIFKSGSGIIRNDLLDADKFEQAFVKNLTKKINFEKV